MRAENFVLHIHKCGITSRFFDSSAVKGHTCALGGRAWECGYGVTALIQIGSTEIFSHMNMCHRCMHSKGVEVALVLIKGAWV